MRMLMHVQLPLEPFNTALRDGTAGQKIQRILARLFRSSVKRGAGHSPRPRAVSADTIGT